MKSVKPLLRTSRPYSDESFLGYIIRLIELNHYDNKTWILRLSGIHQNLLQPRNSFVFNGALDLNPLSTLTGLEKGTLSSLLYPYAPPRSCNFFGHKISQFLIRCRFPKVCPPCLQESNYCRKIWDLGMLTVCPAHRCLLIDACPACGNPISWVRRKVSGCPCGFDWRNVMARAIEGPILRLAAQLYKLCGLQSEEAHLVGLPKDSPLSTLNFEDMMSVLLLVSSQLNGAKNSKGIYLSSPCSLSDLHTLFEKTLTVFADWPESFFRFLEWLRTRPPLPYLKGAAGIEKDFGGFYDVLYKKSEERAFSFMRSAFEDYIANRWDGGLLQYRYRMRVKNNGAKVRYVGKAETTRLLGVDAFWIEKFINDGRLKGAIRDEGKQRAFLIERDSVESLKKAFDESLTLQEVMSRLGVGKYLILRLVEGGCLKALRGPKLDNYAGWKFDRSSVDDFMSKIDSLPPIGGGKSERTLTFGQAVKALIGSSLYVSDFVKAVFGGSLAARRDRSLRGLHSLVFEQRTVSAFITGHLRSQGSTLTVSVGEAARVLRTDSKTISILINRKILPAHQALKGKWTRREIFRKDVEAFARTYVMPSYIAHSLQTSSQTVSSLLLGHGLKPVSGPSVDEGHRFVFKKSEVDCLNLVELLSEQRQGRIQSTLPRRTGAVKTATVKRSGKKRLWPEDVAELLSIDERQVYDLVSSRSLRSCRKIDGETMMKFTPASVEKYKRRLSSGLVTYHEAAKMLGATLMSFRAKWIYTGRLKPAKVEVRGKVTYYYLRRKDVETIVEFHAATMDLHEAAKMLCVNAWNVDRRLKRAGMKAVAGPLVDGFRKKRYLRTDIQSLLTYC